ncbi:MAG: DUF3667 domain-containing protein [Saprospiraceae bacterium]
MSVASQHVCRNCDFENKSSFQFCPNCGQKNTDGKITFSELWSEFQDSVLNIESRTWRTFKSLFIPGKLTLEYFAGRHRKYVHPLRLLLVTSVLVIVAMSFQDFQSSTNHYYNITDRIKENYERQKLKRILENIVDSTNNIFPSQETELITDTIVTVFRDSLDELLDGYGDGYGNGVDLNYYMAFGNEGQELVLKRDFLEMDEKELTQKYKNDASWYDRLLFKQKAKYIKDESQLSAAFISHLTWAILLMMPFLALGLYTLYYRHTYYYIEHLIFAFHIHSFAFLVLTILIFGINIIPLWMFFVLLGVIATYLFISMWRVYQQSIWKTLLKFVILNIFYAALFVLFLFGTFIITFLLL